MCARHAFMNDTLIYLFIWQIDPSKGYKGITCFLVTKDMGVQIAKKEQKLGIRASSTCSLNFDDLKVPAENVIGGEGLGYKIAIEILNEGAASPPVFPFWSY